MSRGLAVVVPGRAYPVEMPLLAVTIRTLTERGWPVRPVRWDYPYPDDPDAWVRDQVLDALAGEAPTLVVGKSMGTRAASYAAELAVPAIWLTPLLREASCVAGLRANPAPQLLVGGAADEIWDVAVAASLVPGSCGVCEIADADHAMAVPDDPDRTAAILEEVTRAVESFLDGLG